MMPEPIPSGDASFSDLMASHQVRLMGYIRSLVPDEHAAKDILQETNITLMRKSRDFEKGTHFTAWAFRVAYFEVLSWRRNRGREKLQFSDELVESLAETSSRLAEDYDSRLEALKVCLDKLPERQRDIVRRRYLSGISVQDIAAELNFNANAVSQLLHRARTNLFDCINRITGGKNG